VGRTTARWIALTVCVGATLSACGDDDKSGDDNGSEKPVVVQITFKGGDVTPSGDRVDVDTGQEIEFDVTADEPGEIHVHSEPEEEFEYEAGEKTFTFKIDRPGLVTVESHTYDKVIVQLEVK
jgi:hypothetical protein